MPQTVHFFLGANSADGFYSLYEQLLDPSRAKRIYLLKGGAGSGKSTLIRRVGEAMEKHGEAVEYIHCSGDPDSMDAVHLPERGAAVIDATAPHVLEPNYAGAVEQYIDLSRCCDWRALQPVKGEIVSCTDAYRACYARAYRCLGAAQKVDGDVRDLLLTPGVAKKIERRARGILSRECKSLHGKPGGRTLRFLGGPTCQGEIVLAETVKTLCDRIYDLAGICGLTHEMLRLIADGAEQAGYQIILCLSPLEPERIGHLLIPALRLGFVTGGVACGDAPPYRRIRFDAMPEPEMLHRHKTRLRFARRVSATLHDEAVVALKQAKAIHDELEALYNPHVDFDRVRSIADEIAAELLEEGPSASAGS